MDITFVCERCGAATAWPEPRWCCTCGGLLSPGALPPFDPSAIDPTDGSLWRYRHILPPVAPVTCGEGWTPLLPATIDGHALQLKLDYVNPTASFKDRGATVQVSRLAASGVTQVVEDSSGNAGAALATYCARAGLSCTIVCPATASPGKMALIEAVGARVVPVPGPREASAAAALDLARERFYASHVWDPSYLLGTATLAYEIAEQRRWRPPETLVVPVGNGSLLLGLEFGFRHLAEAGVVPHVPRLVAVQAAACAPLAALWTRAEPAAARPTLAEGIAVARPLRAQAILSALRRTGGRVVTVDEDDLRAATLRLHRAGWYVEPTSAAAVAALRLLDPRTERDLVVVLTGSALKAG